MSQSTLPCVQTHTEGWMATKSSKIQISKKMKTFLFFCLSVFGFFGFSRCKNQTKLADELVIAKRQSWCATFLVSAPASLYNMAAGITWKRFPKLQFQGIFCDMRGCIWTIGNTQGLEKIQTGYPAYSQHSASRVATRDEEDVVWVLHTQLLQMYICRILKKGGLVPLYIRCPQCASQLVWSKPKSTQC